MDPLFHKALPVLFLPLGASLLMLAAGLRWRSRAFIVLPLAILWLTSTPVVADSLMRSLEDRYSWRPNAGYPAADAVFALGGGILGARDHPGAEVQWGASADRFERALSLFTSGRAPVLLLSAGWPRDRGELGEGARLREIAIQRGVPPESIILTRETLDTAAEAGFLAELAARLHWKRVLLVTSAFHMPRAMRLFRGCPTEIVPVPVNYQTPGMPSGSSALDHYLPQAEALFRSERASREYLGILFYSVKGLATSSKALRKVGSDVAHLGKAICQRAFLNCKPESKRIVAQDHQLHQQNIVLDVGQTMNQIKPYLKSGDVVLRHGVLHIWPSYNNVRQLDRTNLEVEIVLNFTIVYGNPASYGAQPICDAAIERLVDFNSVHIHLLGLA